MEKMRVRETGVRGADDTGPSLAGAWFVSGRVLGIPEWETTKAWDKVRVVGEQRTFKAAYQNFDSGLE